MKTTALFMAFLMATASCAFSQSDEADLLGKWQFFDLEHFNADNANDREASEHYWKMLEGRTLKFKKKGTVEIPMYEVCSWYIEENYLHMQYSETGKWNQGEILLLDANTLKLRYEVDYPEDGNVQIITYKKL